VYSLGSVLYEMLAGEPPHTGGSAQAVIMKIVTDRARPVSDLRRSVPGNVAAAVEKSLEKLAADRFESAKAFSDALANPGFTVAGTSAGRSVPADSDRWKRVAIGLGIATTALIVVSAISWFRPPARLAAGPSVSARVELPDDVTLDYQSLCFSPDGSRLYAVVRQSGTRVIWERKVDEFGGRGIPGTEGSIFPVTTADGQSLILRSGDGGLVRVPLAGGPPVLLDARGNLMGRSGWGPDGTLYYGRNYKSGLWRIGPGSPEPAMVTAPDSTDSSELAHLAPQMLPGGRHLMFNVFRTPLDSARIEAIDLRSGERRVLIRGGIAPVYANGFLIFARAGSLMAVRFDPDRLVVDGEPVPVLNNVAVRQMEGVAAYAIASNGTLAYIASTDFDAPSELVWVDRGGKETPLDLPPAQYENPALSPDGKRLAVSITTGSESADLWVIDLSSGARTRLTTGGGMDFDPVWSFDGASVVYVSERPVFDLYTRPADGSGPSRPFVTSPYDKFPGTFSPDGNELVFEQSTLPFSQIWRVKPDERMRPWYSQGNARCQIPRFLQMESGSRSNRANPAHGKSSW
jgi:serine/threonine-protein kinase